MRIERKKEVEQVKGSCAAG